MDVNNKINIAIQKCEEELSGLNRFPSVPVIIKSLNNMLLEIHNKSLSKEKKDKIVGAIGKIITDDFSFMNSEIGKAVSEAVNGFLNNR